MNGVRGLEKLGRRANHEVETEEQNEFVGECRNRLIRSLKPIPYGRASLETARQTFLLIQPVSKYYVPRACFRHCRYLD